MLAHEVRLSGLYRFAADSRSAVPEGIAGTIRRIYGPLLPEGLASSGRGHRDRGGALRPADGARGHRPRRPLPRHLARRRTPRASRCRAGTFLARRRRCRSPPRSSEPRASRRPGSPAHRPGPGSSPASGSSTPSSSPTGSCVAFAALATDHPDLVLALVGPVSIELARELRRLGEELGVADRLIITGRVDAGVYLAWLERAELAVQLRASFSGEASAAVGDCLARRRAHDRHRHRLDGRAARRRRRQGAGRRGTVGAGGSLPAAARRARGTGGTRQGGSQLRQEPYLRGRRPSAPRDPRLSRSGSVAITA